MGRGGPTDFNAERHGAYRIVFFLNDVPPAVPDGDVFYDGGSKAIDRFLPADHVGGHAGAQHL